MSRIFTKWTCDECKHTFDHYVSFGHPDKDFIFKWKCRDCGHVNNLKVEAWPSEWRSWQK